MENSIKENHTILIIISGDGFMNDVNIKEGCSFVIHQEKELSFKGQLEIMFIYSSNSK